MIKTLNLFNVTCVKPVMSWKIINVSKFLNKIVMTQSLIIMETIELFTFRTVIAVWKELYGQ